MYSQFQVLFHYIVLNFMGYAYFFRIFSNKFCRLESNYIHIQIKQMQDSMVSNKRSSSRKNSVNRQHRDSPDYKNGVQLLASKFGDLSQRGLVGSGNSRQLGNDNRKMKNPAENTQYIRNLYKKYLGKENTNPSDRKTKTDSKDLQQNGYKQKNLVTQACKQKLTYGMDSNKTPAFSSPIMQKNIKTLQEGPESNHKSHYKKEDKNNITVSTNLFKKTSENIHEKNSLNGGKNKHKTMYDDMLDKDYLTMMGDQRSSIVLAMNTINGIRKRIMT